MPVYNGIDANGNPTEYHRQPDGKYKIKNKDYNKLIGSREEVFYENAYKTKFGVFKNGLTKNKWGKIVSRKKQRTAKLDMRLLKCGHGFRKGVFIENGVRIPSKIQRAINTAYQSGYTCTKDPENFKYEYPRQRLDDLPGNVKAAYKKIKDIDSPLSNETGNYYAEHRSLKNPENSSDYYNYHNIAKPKLKYKARKLREKRKALETMEPYFQHFEREGMGAEDKAEQKQRDEQKNENSGSHLFNNFDFLENDNAIGKERTASADRRQQIENARIAEAKRRAAEAKQREAAEAKRREAAEAKRRAADEAAEAKRRESAEAKRREAAEAKRREEEEAAETKRREEEEAAETKRRAEEEAAEEERKDKELQKKVRGDFLFDLDSLENDDGIKNGGKKGTIKYKKTLYTKKNTLKNRTKHFI